VRLSIIACSLVLAAACGAKSDDAPATRSKEEQRAVDSTVGASGLPGSQGVRGAMAASDSAAKRARELDSLSRLP
jgi:hypothetical protein